MKNKPVVGIVFGGRSVEHHVSIRSAENVFQNIDRNLFEPFLIGIDQMGDWYLTEQVNSSIGSGRKLKLNLSASNPEFNHQGESLHLDVIFPVLHGTDGEDGSIQGLLEVINLPCVGSGVLGSSVSMNKLTTKHLLINAGIPSSKFISIHKYDNPDTVANRVESDLKFPVIIKPVSLGSSVGVFKVNNKEQLKDNLEQSLEYDQQVLIEQFIAGRELECAILGNSPPRASMPGEIVVNNNEYDFYTFDAKYVDADAVKLIIPAELQDNQIKEIQKLALKSFVTLHCEDYARVDLFMTEENKIFINEINTIPGFTNSSMFPMLWKNSGIEYKDLITELINLSLDRHQKKQQINTKYESKLDG